MHYVTWKKIQTGDLQCLYTLFFYHSHCCYRFREMQSKWESQLSEVHNQLKVKGFEAERSQLVYEEAMKNLRASEMDIDKLQKKAEVGRVDKAVKISCWCSQILLNFDMELSYSFKVADAYGRHMFSPLYPYRFASGTPQKFVLLHLCMLHKYATDVNQRSQRHNYHLTALLLSRLCRC